MEKKVAIILLTCNQPKLLEKCLISIKKKTDYKNYKVYLIDDGGKGEIGTKIKKKFSWANVIINKKNIGCSKSINKGIKKSLQEFSPDYFLLLNDDLEFIEKNWLKKIVDAGEENEINGIIGCKLVYPKGNLQWFFKNRKMYFVPAKKNVLETKETFQTKEVEDIIGACFLIKKRVIQEIGFFDEKFSPIYGEETDFCYRARKKGFKMIYVGNTKVIHYGSASEKKSEKSGGKWFLQKSHAIRFEWLNFEILKIIKYTFMHFGSAIKRKKPFIGLQLLLKAYKENLKDLKEIKQKRKERFSWKKIFI